MTTSRIFVRNLPVNITEKDFKAHFSQRHDITDARVIPHKRIGYVGYSTPEDAQDAVKYFNKTFIRMSKLSVELARGVNDTSLHPTKVRLTGANAAVAKEADGLENKQHNPLKRKRPSPPPEQSDPKLKEFLDVMQAPSKSKAWKDDTLSLQQAATSGSDTLLDSNRPEASLSDDEYQSIQNKKKQKSSLRSEAGRDESEAPIEFGHIRKDSAADSSVPSIQDDSNWLRSKTGQLLGLQDEQDEQDQAEFPTARPHSAHRESPDVGAEPNQQQGSRGLAVKPVGTSTPAATDEAEDQIRKSKRLFLRNLPFTITEEALMEHFSSYGGVEETHVPMNNVSGKGKGFAYVLFHDAEPAIQAYKALDGTIFQGRLLHILPAGAKRESKVDEFTLSKMPLKQQKRIKQKSQAATSTFNWNSLYMNPDAVMSSIASRLGVDKSALYDPTSTDAAVKQTQAETHIISETKKYFMENGIDLEAFRNKKRGDTAILVKNFPFGTSIDELRQLFEPFGRITRLLMPPTGTVAIVEFAVAPEARAAFKGLAYRKVKESILFLEPGPKDLFTSDPRPPTSTSAIQDTPAVAPKISASDLLRSDPEAENTDTTTLHVRNLNFTTTTEKLTETFSPIQGFVSAVVRTKFDPKRNETLSRGYGFLEFRTRDQALAALSAMNGYALEGHRLDIKLSQKTLDAGEEQRRADKAKAQAAQRTKIIVKNLAFEASKKDIRELVKQYGSIRSVRLPRKYDNSLRGFAFVEFSTPLEAQQAYDALRHSHYHGRKLVIDFAEADAEDAEEQLEQMTKKVNSQANKLTAQKLIGAGRKKFNVSGEGPES